jgi:hypothetical protein
MLLTEEVMYLGSYADAVEIENGMKPPAYEEVQPATECISQPMGPPSTALISVFSEPIRIEYEENERIQQAGCSKLIWNYYACFGYVKEDIIEKFNDTNFSMCWTLIGCFCCLIPLTILLIIFLRV